MVLIPPLLRQYGVVMAVNLIILSVGIDLGWTSPALIKLRDPVETPLSRPITESEGSWIVSIGYIFSLFAIPFVGVLADYIGRKHSMLITCLPKIISGVMIIFTTDVWMLLVARAINLTLNPAATMIVMIYSTEVASKEVRGLLGSLIGILSTFGSLLMLGIGPYISYLNLSILLTAVTVCGCIPLLFVPDTPYSLYNKGKIEEAKKVILFFRGSATLVEEEIKELSRIEPKQKFDKRDIIKNKTYRKSIIIAVCMGIAIQSNGYLILLLYLQTILEFTNTSISPALCSLIFGIIQALASIFAALLSDRFGRKTIIISTSLGMALGMIGLGSFFILKENGIIISGFLNYLPIISIALVTWCYNGGIGSQYFVLITELLDNNIRAIGTTASIMASTATVFIVSKYALDILSAVGPVVTFIMFGVICIKISFVIHFFVPETKQMTIADIQKALGGLKEDVAKKTCISQL